MSNVTYQLDENGNAVAQGSIDAAAKVNVAGGAVGIDPTLNTMTVQPTPLSVAGPLNASTVALATSLVVKSTAGRLFRINGANTKVAAQYIQVHDSATLPAEGNIAKVTIPVPASSAYTIDFGLYGRVFVNGIVVCNSSTAATKTIGSADISADCQYL